MPSARRRGLPGQEQRDQPAAAVPVHDVAGPDDGAPRAGQAGGAAVRGRRRPTRVLAGAGVQLLSRVLRRAGPPVRGAGRAAGAVRGQRARVPVARQPVRARVHRRLRRPVRRAHGRGAARAQRRGRRVRHGRRPADVHAAAAGARAPAPRAAAARGAGRRAPRRVAHAGQQPSAGRLRGAARARLRAGGRHARGTGRRVAAGAYRAVLELSRHADVFKPGSKSVVGCP